MNDLHKVEIKGDYRPTLKIDGHQILAKACDLYLDARQLPVLRVSLDVLQIDIGTEATVFLDESTATALKAMGWTPPAVSA